MNLYKCLYCDRVYHTFQSRNAHQGKCESNLLESMPENHEDPRKEVKRINERLETISNVIFRLTSEAETLNQRRSEIIEKYREMLQ